MLDASTAPLRRRSDRRMFLYFQSQFQKFRTLHKEDVKKCTFGRVRSGALAGLPSIGLTAERPALRKEGDADQPTRPFPARPREMPGTASAPVSCARCSAVAAISVSPSPLCRNCFQAHTQVSYKRALGRGHYAPRSPAPAALLVSGGPASAALALLHSEHVAALPHHPTQPARAVILVHVATCEAATAAVTALADRLRLPLYVVPAPARPELRDVSDAERVYAGWVRNAGLTKARETGADVALVGTTADRAAVDVLWRVVFGCGEGVGDGAKAEGSWRGMTVLRPLLHMELKSVVLYGRFFGSGETCGGEGWERGGTGRGLRGLLEKFVEGVQKENGSVAHNVVRTAGRLVGVSGATCCAGCGDALVSGEECEENGSAREDSGSGECARGGSAGDDVRGESAAVPLCYGCREAVRRAGGMDGGGAAVVESRQAARRRELVRNSIGDYLLDGGDSDDSGHGERHP